MSTTPPLELWHESERPREKLLRLGAASLSEAELLAILLQAGTAGRSALDTARVLLGEFKSLRGLLTAERQRVCRTRGLGDAKFAMLQASLELTRRHYAEEMQAGPPLANPRATRDYLRARLRDAPARQRGETADSKPRRRRRALRARPPLCSRRD